MRPPPWAHLERCRIQLSAPWDSAPGDDYGAFLIRYKNTRLRCLAGNARIAQEDLGDDYAWDHVSVSIGGPLPRCPTWEEMAYVKDLFFKPEETVFQFHPAISQYVNCHPHTLHLWRPLLVTVPLPPSVMV